MFDEDSTETMVAFPSEPQIPKSPRRKTPSPKLSQAKQSVVPVVEALPPPALSVSPPPAPDPEDIETAVSEKPKYARKVGAGTVKQAVQVLEDDIFDAVSFIHYSFIITCN